MRVRSRLNIKFTSVSALEFSGSALVSPQQFAAAKKLHPGDVASQQALETAYRHQGYMDGVVDAADARPRNHQVAYTVTVIPGDPYRIGTLNIVNLPPPSASRSIPPGSCNRARSTTPSTPPTFSGTIPP